MESDDNGFRVVAIHQDESIALPSHIMCIPHPPTSGQPQELSTSGILDPSASASNAVSAKRSEEGEQCPSFHIVHGRICKASPLYLHLHEMSIGVKWVTRSVLVYHCPEPQLAPVRRKLNAFRPPENPWYPTPADLLSVYVVQEEFIIDKGDL